MKKRQELFAPVWRHWKDTFHEYRFWIVGTLASYGAGYYLNDVFKAVIWKRIVDMLSAHQNPFGVFLYIPIIGILTWCLNRFGDYCIIQSESNIIRNLKNYALKHLLTYDTNYFLNTFNGSIVAKARRFSAVSETVYDNIVFRILRLVIILPGVFFSIVYTVPLVGFVLLGWSIIFGIVAWKFAMRRVSYNLESAKAETKTSGHLSDIVGSIHMVQSYAREYSEYDNFTETTKFDHEKRFKKWLQKNYQTAVQSILVLILEVTLMYFVVKQSTQGFISIGTVVLVQSFIGSVIMNMWELGRSIADIQAQLADANEMAESLSEKIDFKEEEKIPTRSIKDIRSNEILFESVKFLYPGRSISVLKDVTVNLESGKRYGIVGRTGSGKTTITRLLLRQFDLQKDSGGIKIGGISIYDLPKDELRKLISYVPQDPHFPFRTIREIISFGNQEATDDQIIQAAKQASCHDFIIEDLEYGYSTLVGEQGVKLSGGQRQRLAIAAAFLKDSPIIILDEPTAALDSETEEAIQHILKCMTGKTMIVIAHRLATVAGLDEIIVLDKGSIVEKGSHQDLISNPVGMYTKFWKKQFHL